MACPSIRQVGCGVRLLRRSDAVVKRLLEFKNMKGWERTKAQLENVHLYRDRFGLERISVPVPGLRLSGLIPTPLVFHTDGSEQGWAPWETSSKNRVLRSLEMSITAVPPGVCEWQAGNSPPPTHPHFLPVWTKLHFSFSLLTQSGRKIFTSPSLRLQTGSGYMDMWRITFHRHNFRNAKLWCVVLHVTEPKL